MLKQADSAKSQADTSELQVLFMNFKSDVPRVRGGLGIDPTKLTDSANTSKPKVAAARVDSFFNRLVKNEVPFVEVSYPLAHALQSKYPFSINETGLDKVIEKAKTLRASSDSSKAQTAPTGTAPATPPDTTQK